MKKVKFYYANLPNMGDLLNPLLVKELFNLDSERRTYLNCELSGIGSGLGQFLTGGSKVLRALKKVSSVIYPEVHVWGTGFINEESETDKMFFKKEMKFHAVRGNLSKARVERILKRKLDIPVGDAGLLADRLIKETIEKKYSVGIIPHFKEQGHPIFQEMNEAYKNSIIIDLMEEPIEVIKKIAQCEIIISTSLHGLIVADSFYIPNQHIVVTSNMKGDGFKYKDYYSAYNIDPNTINLNYEPIPKLEEIVRNYKIKKEMVDKIKNDLIECFPFKYN